MKQIQKLLVVSILFLLSAEGAYAKLISPKDKPANFANLEKTDQANQAKIKKKPQTIDIKKKEVLKAPSIKKEVIKKNLATEIKKENILPKEQVKNKENTDSKISKEEEIITVDQIIPQKKPLLLGVNSAQGSTVLNEKDFAIAKKTFSFVKQRSWKAAFDTAKKSSDKILMKTIRWIYLKDSNNQATFYDYVNFINENKDWPRIGRLRYLAEHKIDYKDTSPNDVIHFFKNTPPTSGYGVLKLGEAYLIKGQITKGTPLIKEGFKNAFLDKNEIKYVAKKFKDIIGPDDFIERAKFMAWEQEYWELNRTIPYLPKGYKELYHARFSLMTRSYGVDQAISRVPAKFSKDIGLEFDRMKWRRKRGRHDSALEIIETYSADPSVLVKPELWMKEKLIIARKKIDEKKYQAAYELFINHGIANSAHLSDAEWHAGWLALSFLNKPVDAAKHFQIMYDSVSYPVSRSRGAFWLAKSYERMSNKNEADKWYSIASNYNATFYGQLAANKIGKKNIQIKNDYSLNSERYEKFLQSEVAKATILLFELKQSSQAKDLLKHLGAEKSPLELRTFAGTLSQKINRLDYSIQIAKQASYEGIALLELNYPVIETPKIVAGKEILNQAYILALIRQESEFDASANSYVGARGLMQIMPATGRVLSKRTGLSYSVEKLTDDEFYNLQLGSFYLSNLYENFDNNIYLALAAYNAGPQRVSKWIKKYGDPRKKQIDALDFLEHIPFEETRNYVQRVMENINVYKFILAKKSVENNIEKLLYNSKN